jgi:hypothetical protein
MDFRIVGGRPRLRASYIMKRDPRARAAYDAIRRRGATAEEAKDTIEEAFQKSFLEVLIAYDPNERGQIARDRRKAEIWLSLQEGLSVDSIFADLPPRPSRPS